jgi:hypothetical protein
MDQYGSMVRQGKAGSKNQDMIMINRYQSLSIVVLFVSVSGPGL